MLTDTGPVVYVVTTTIFISNSYYALQYTLNHLNCLNINIYPGDNVSYWCYKILVDYQRLASARDFNYDNLLYITCIFEDTCYYRFFLWVIHKYKEVAQFINKGFVCDEDVIQPKLLLSYEYLVQENVNEYRYLVE